MRKLFVSTLFTLLLVVPSFASDAKGMNVVLTSGDEQTQMMAMVLSMMTMKQKKRGEYHHVWTCR